MKINSMCLFQGTQNAEPIQNPIFVPQIYADQTSQNMEVISKFFQNSRFTADLLGIS